MGTVHLPEKALKGFNLASSVGDASCDIVVNSVGDFSTVYILCGYEIPSERAVAWVDAVFQRFAPKR